LKTVFICIPWFHPAFRAGGPVQSIANMVNEFDGDTQFRIFCSNTDLNNIKLENIEINKWINYNERTMVWYAGPEKRSESILKQAELLKPDIIYVIGIFSWHFNIVPLVFSKIPSKIVSVRGMLHPGALSQKKLKKQLFLACWKIFNLHKKISFHASDETEEKYIRGVFGEDVNISIAGNFPRKFAARSSSGKHHGNLSLLSIALISPMKNHLLVLQALEHCTGTIEYHICGPVKDMEYWQECMLQIKKLPGNIKIHFHGEVQPNQVNEYLDKCHVFILPSKSENFGHAIYEALSAGKPVITSQHTPWQGLEKNLAGLNVDTEISAITNAIDLFTGMQEAEYSSWSTAAVAYAEKATDLELIKSQYKKMFAG
jgi:glycosyltransferase involved in cell wall biosynthesis